jgi:hypothetical protein
MYGAVGAVTGGGRLSLCRVRGVMGGWHNKVGDSGVSGY